MRFSYWNHWAIMDLTSTKFIWPNDSAPLTPWLTKERNNFYNEFQEVPEERLKALVALLKRHPEDIVREGVVRKLNELREDAIIFEDEVNTEGINIYQKYYLQVLNVLKGDKRGKRTQQTNKEQIFRDIECFKHVLELIRKPGYSVEDAVLQTRKEMCMSERSVWEIYDHYIKVGKSMFQAFDGNWEKVFQCLKLMAENIGVRGLAASLNSGEILISYTVSKSF